MNFYNYLCQWFFSAMNIFFTHIFQHHRIIHKPIGQDQPPHPSPALPSLFLPLPPQTWCCTARAGSPSGRSAWTFPATPSQAFFKVSRSPPPGEVGWVGVWIPRTPLGPAEGLHKKPAPSSPASPSPCPRGVSRSPENRRLHPKRFGIFF